MNVKIEFTHGLGDAVQFTVVLKHLRAAKPDWEIDVHSLRGKHSAFHGLCRASYAIEDPGRPQDSSYDRVYKLEWFENYCGYPDRPNSKVTNCLEEVFEVKYLKSLGRYEIRIPGRAAVDAAAYFESIGCRREANGRYNAMLIHYQGNTSPSKKNCGHEDCLLACETAIAAGLIPVVLDWDSRSPIPDNKRIFNPSTDHPYWQHTGTGDAVRIAALTEAASLFIGIDSGPGKCASSTDTPTLICWTGHHPIRFHDPAANTEHLVPEEHLNLPPLRGNGALAEYFEAHYRYSTYGRGSLGDAVAAWIRGNSDAGVHNIRGFSVPAENPMQSLTIIDDVYGRDSYKTHLRPKADGVEYVVDVGANIGCFARLYHERNPLAKIACVEVNAKLLRYLKQNIPADATIYNAACHYGPDELMMLDAVHADGISIGGSRIVPRSVWEAERDTQYIKHPVPVPLVTLETIAADLGWPHIDVLKLDCEGSEFSILGNCDLSKVKFIYGEYHGWEQFAALLRGRLKGWDFGHMSSHGEFGIFHLVNPGFA